MCRAQAIPSEHRAPTSSLQLEELTSRRFIDGADVDFEKTFFDRVTARSPDARADRSKLPS
jgi:hypothetical protein